MKITKIELKNFQGHKDSVLYPKEGLNALTGSSGAGKSSIHRALTWLIENKVAGDRPNTNIHNHNIVSETKSGATKFLGNTEVTVHLDNNHIVQRVKGKDNLYRMTYPDNSIKEFTANGTNVPLEVQELFKFDYLNIADQADSYFIMFDTPGSIATKINEIVDLSLGDKLLKAIKSKTRENNSKIKNIKEDIKNLEDSLKEYENLDLMENDLDKLTLLCNTKDQLEEKLIKLKESREVIAEIEYELESIGDVASELESIQALSVLYENVVQLRDKKRLMESYIDDLDYLNKELVTCIQVEEELKALDNLQVLFNKALSLESAYRVYQEKTKEIKELNTEIKNCMVDGLVGSVDDLLVKAHRMALLQERLNGITEAMQQLTELNLELKNVSVEADKAEEEFHKALDSNGVCPLCGK